MPPEENKNTEVSKEETKATTETTVETPPVSEPTNPETPPEAPEKETAGAIFDKTVPEKKKETVGLDKFLELKKQNKDFQARIQELESMKADGATKVEISGELEDIAKEFPDVDPKFLQMIGKAVEKKASEIAEQAIKPISDKEKSEKINSAFEKHYNATLEEMPEYDGVVNKDVIKALALDPRNADKTFPQIIEEAYGNAIQGKRTIETTKPGGGKEPAPLDVDRARKDSAYFAEVMADPKLKAEYNDQMLKRGI